MNLGSSAMTFLSASGNLSALLASVAPAGNWQLALLLWLQSLRHPVLTWIMGGLTMLGDDLFYVAVLSLMYWIGSSTFADGHFGSHRLRANYQPSIENDGQQSALRRQNTFELMQLVVFSVLLNIVIKNLVDAPRPFEASSVIEGLWTFTAGSASFPSGHAQTAATFWLAAGAGIWKRRRGRLATIGIACSIVFLISLSRLYLGVHWPQDVLAGGLIGGVLGLWGPSLLRQFSRWFYIPTFALSAIGILVFRDHSAVQLTGLLIGATIGHAQAGSDPVGRAKPVLMFLGIITVAAAYGTTTWLLSAIGLQELVVDGLATLETGLMITWGVPALFEAVTSEFKRN